MSGVLHLISGGDTGGAKPAVLSLLKGLSGTERATLVCFRDGPFAEDARALGIDTRVIHGNGTLGDLKKLAALAREGGYDMLHSHGSRGNAMAALAKTMTGLPTLTTIHSDYKLDYLGSPLRGLFFGGMNRWALGRMDHIVCVSDQMAELMIRRGFRPSRVHTIYNGLDFTIQPPTANRDALLSSWGTTRREGDIIVGCAARMDKVKDLGTLIAAMGIAAKACPQLKLVLFGDGAERAALERQVNALNIRDKVTFAGWQSEPELFFQAVDINVLTSLHETFGFVLVEGSRSSPATVATNVGGIPAIIDHGVTGLLFAPRDAHMLAEHLKTLYLDASLRRRLGAALKAKCEREFSLDKTVATQAAIYQKVRGVSERAKRPGRDGVTICGAYGYRNVGDEAILGAILTRLRGIDPFVPITLLSRSPKDTAAEFREDTRHTFNLFRILRAFRRSTLYINGGGNLIQDATSTRSLWFYLMTLWLAKKSGAGVLMYACGIGPVRGNFNARLSAKVLSRNVDAITTREQATPRELSAIGAAIANTRLTADCALSLKPAAATAVDAAALEIGLDPEKKYLCLTVRRWRGFDRAIPAFAALMDAAWRDYGLTTLILPLEVRHLGNAAVILVNYAGGGGREPALAGYKVVFAHTLDLGGVMVEPHAATGRVGDIGQHVVRRDRHKPVLHVLRMYKVPVVDDLQVLE
ncbi:hypothetical protein FACS1894217_14480 [Clostridia bacterium]|nr:hypothetical protein FACS1894217_14480 [Clostridia bacterium]